MSNPLFYSQLTKHRKPVCELLGHSSLFQEVPVDWHIIVTDIKSSTLSVQNGLSEVVNLIATGSIVAALNIAHRNTVDIPFFFGGDGATMLVPPNLLEETMEALYLHQQNTLKEFDIHLRVGSIPVGEVYDNQQDLRIAKASVSHLLTVPVVLGNGLQFVEKRIKSRDSTAAITSWPRTQLNLEGMECRWNKVSPPENSKEVVSFLINALSESRQAAVFQEILRKTDQVYGPLQDRNPISVPQLKLNLGFQKIRTELRAKNSQYRIMSFLKVWITGLIGKYYFFSNSTGQSYLNEVTQLSDILVIDGSISMVISGTTEQRQLLTDYLEGMEQQGLILFGSYVSAESVMSCYIHDRNSKHIHFVDGGSGGYTRAAMVLKEKIRNRDIGLRQHD